MKRLSTIKKNKVLRLVRGGATAAYVSREAGISKNLAQYYVGKHNKAFASLKDLVARNKVESKYEKLGRAMVTLIEALR